MYSDAPNVYSNDGWADVAITPTEEELTKIKDNWRIFVKDNSLTFLPNEFDKPQLDVDKIKQDLAAATNVNELKNIITNLLDNL